MQFRSNTFVIFVVVSQLRFLTQKERNSILPFFRKAVLSAAVDHLTFLNCFCRAEQGKLCLPYLWCLLTLEFEETYIVKITTVG